MLKINIVTDEYTASHALSLNKNEMKCLLADVQNLINNHLLDKVSNDIEAPSNEQTGYLHPETGTHFYEGQEIFRVYKHTRYAATARQGTWIGNDGRIFNSLFHLDKEITGGKSKFWQRWKTFEKGKEVPLQNIRGLKCKTSS